MEHMDHNTTLFDTHRTTDHLVHRLILVDPHNHRPQN